jgi:hypothetical protein
MEIYLRPMNCAFKMVKMESCMYTLTPPLSTDCTTRGKAKARVAGAQSSSSEAEGPVVVILSL